MEQCPVQVLSEFKVVSKMSPYKQAVNYVLLVGSERSMTDNSLVEAKLTLSC